MDAPLLSPVILVSAVALAVTVTACMAVAVLSSGGDRKVRKERFATYIQRQSANKVVDARNDNRRKDVDKKIKDLESSKRERGGIGGVRANIIRAGLEVPVGQYWLACIAFGFVVSMIWLLLGSQRLATPFVFIFFTFLVPRTVLKFMAGRRQKKFTKNFADSIDILVRGLSTGLPIGECFRIIARESPPPVNEEFMIVLDEVNAGLTMQMALDRAFERMPTQELRFFATVISIQSQTGGNLAEILSSISGVLRGRHQLREKIKALAGEARATSSIIGALPFLVGGVLTIINRPYIEILWTTRSGNIVFAIAACMMTFGIYVMNAMAKVDN